jgi:hypothetical protein
MRRLWWCLHVLAMPLFVLAILINLPRLCIEWLRWAGKQLVRPMLYCRKRSQGWRKVRPLWTKNATNDNRRRVRS